LVVVAIIAIGLPPNGTLPATAGGENISPEALLVLVGGAGIAAAVFFVYWRSRR
jgi:hypothetical protein